MSNWSKNLGNSHSHSHLNLKRIKFMEKLSLWKKEKKRKKLTYIFFCLFFFLFIRFTCNTLKKLCIYTFHQIIKY